MKRNDYIFFSGWFIVIIIALTINDQTPQDFPIEPVPVLISSTTTVQPKIIIHKVTNGKQLHRYVIKYRDKSEPFKIIDCEYLICNGDMFTFRAGGKVIWIVSARLIDSIELYDKK